MSCNCEGKTYNVSFGCCEPVLAPIQNYYTKYQIDKMIEEIESGITSGCCITPEEVDEKIASAKTEIENEIPSLSGYATEEWVLDKHYISGVDLSDYALKSEIPTVPTSNTAFTNDAGYLTEDDYPDLASYATKEWVINQNYVSNSELIQYITNLQNQIDSLKEQISGCCGSTGETITRWITMTGDNDYTCSGTTKMTKEKEQQSTDGGNTWADTGNYRTGSTVLETNSVDCGYTPALKFDGKLHNGGEVKVNCNSSLVLAKEEVYTGNYYTAVTIGNCVDSIAEKAFINSSNMIINLNIPSNVKTIGRMAFANSGISALTLNEGVETLGEGAFKACSRLTAVTIPNSVKTLIGDVFYANKIKTLVIGSGVTSIGTSAFSRSSSISGESITILATTPPTLGDGLVFSGWSCPIYVPSASVNAYKAAWSTYASRIQAIQ